MTAPGPGARLALGTAQLGLHYGVANRTGRPARAQAAAILAAAQAVPVAFLDTAPAYGDAEALLGELLPPAAPVAVVTKTPSGVAARPGGVGAALAASLQRLRRPRVEGLLVHDRRELLAAEGEALWRALVALRERGVVARLGVSVYHPEEALALHARFPLEIVQLPCNVLDQRAWSSGLIADLASAGVEVHVRSAFLQGALLLPPEQLPPWLAHGRAAVAAFQAHAQSLGLTPLQAALGFVAALPGVHAVVCGAERPEQLAELVAGLGTRVVPGDFTRLASADRTLVDPSQWQVPR